MKIPWKPYENPIPRNSHGNSHGKSPSCHHETPHDSPLRHGPCSWRPVDLGSGWEFTSPNMGAVVMGNGLYNGICIFYREREMHIHWFMYLFIVLSIYSIYFPIYLFIYSKDYTYNIYITLCVWCMYACMHACMDAWMHGCMDVCMHACMHVCMYIVYCTLYINNLAYLNYDVYLRLKMGDQPPSIAISIGKMMIDIDVFGGTLFIRQTQMSLRCFGGKLPGSHFVPNELFPNSFPSTNPTSTVWSVWYDVWQLAIWPFVLCQHPTEHRLPLICRDPCNSQEINGIFHCIHVSTFMRITPRNQGSICPEGNKGLLAGMKFLHVLEAILHRRAVTTTGRTAPCHDLGICRSHKRFHRY